MPYETVLHCAEFNCTILYCTVQARHQHALECYSTTEQRARGLRQWIQIVLDQIINKDLEQNTREVRVAADRLREERIRLMKVRKYLLNF